MAYRQNFINLLERCIHFFDRRPKYVFLQRLSFDLSEKGINNSATKEKQTSAIFEKLETNHLVKL